ncbi:MAG: hypothetical protein GXO17_06540 [Thermodesulfobacteria bacterium]|nr:hypothetical protein [Thermodesulfobacteriota bacterium]
MARYLLVGHLTKDLVPGGFRYGGAVLYAGLTARRLGFDTLVITASAEKGLDKIFPELRVYNFLAPETTVFENVETPTGRQQFVHHRAPPLPLDRLTRVLRRAEIVHLAPVLDEVRPEDGRIFETEFLVANPQGWFREVLPDGRVVRKRPDLSRAPRFKALVVSEEDLGGEESLVEDLLSLTDILVVTKGSQGAELFCEGERLFLPTKPRPVRDPTGAGDVLAAGFFGMLYATGKPKVALEFAQCLAGIKVTREGLAGVPTWEEISSCLERP